jgi:hypothetical protein
MASLVGGLGAALAIRPTSFAHDRPPTRRGESRFSSAQFRMRTPYEQTARNLHVTARQFVLRSACRCQSLAIAAKLRLQKYLISLKILVGAQGIEPWTSPV